MTDQASLRPVSGNARVLERLLSQWLEAETPEPLVVQTSGSTALPKDVVLSASALRASASATLARLGGPGQWVLALPAHYVAGLQVITRSVVGGISPVLLDEHPDLADATRAMTSNRRYLAVVPTQLHRWLRSDAQTLATYDAVLVGGSATSPALLADARAAGVRVVTTYGMSETCGGCVYDGVPLDGVAVALGASGRVRIAGPVLFDGYVGQPDLTAEVLRDGWFHTSDLGRLDDDGRLVVLGRFDDIVVSGGVNVSLSAVESRLRQMPGVGEVAVTSRPDAEWGAEVVAVFPTGVAVPSLDDVRDFVSAGQPRAWAPRALMVCDLPRLESGKVDRQRLAEEVR